MPENMLQANGEKTNGQREEEAEEVDVHFEPIVSLPLIDVSSNEEDEVEMIKLRAKLYRYDSTSEPAEWKERGTGDVKLLRHKTKHTVRVVMRRDKTLKICANHFVTPWMELKPNCGSDRAWVWSVLADYADELLKPELLAIRFANAENASLWKEAFEKAKKIVGTECSIYSGKKNPDEEDSDSDSYVTYSDDSDEESDVKKSPTQKTTAEEADEKPKDNTDDKAHEVTQKLEKLDVKEEESKESK
ncbi:ran-specific GTPase-activating protein-like [Fopius arisanus]|uniref:Ran-specific GTPase-activating protein-like n=1 Tax=Fopius arisanus TaxID=64838 RepID=A0A9R1TV88_9HYME|nr:PREDICTED: ran-specific GTPase-activating protein-like [Fopius arisanus]